MCFSADGYREAGTNADSDVYINSRSSRPSQGILLTGKQPCPQTNSPDILQHFEAFPLPSERSATAVTFLQSGILSTNYRRQINLKQTGNSF